MDLVGRLAGAAIQLSRSRPRVLIGIDGPDSFDYPARLGGCLRPFRDRATRLVVATYDFRAGTPRPDRAVEVPDRAVLIFDGLFLLRSPPPWS